jgi:L-2,4-diaminobutyric acid acetyltransferase
MLDGLTLRVAEESGIDSIETTVTPDNTPSNRLFTSYGQRHSAAVAEEVLFDAGLFPEDGHEPEVLYRIGPVVFPGATPRR